MPHFTSHSKAYALESDGTKRLTIRWDGGPYNVKRNIRLHVDGQLVGTIPTVQDAQAGRQFFLPDGSDLKICHYDGQFLIHFNGQDISLLRHPNRDLRTITRVNFGFGGILIVYAIFILLTNLIETGSKPLAYVYLAGGVVLVFAALLVRSNVFLSNMAFFSVFLLISLAGIIYDVSLNQFIIFFCTIFSIIGTVLHHRKANSRSIPHGNN